jgi:thioesterase-3
VKTIKIKVRGYHLDVFSHVNNARYLEFIEEARWHAFEEGNVTPELFAQKGITFAVVNINISYKYPAGLGQILRIETAFKAKGSKSITLSQKIFLDDSDTLVVDAEVTFVIIDIKTGRAMELTAEVDEVINSFR